jgi:inner membrane protein
MQSKFLIGGNKLSDFSILQSAVQGRIKSRSMGLKLLVVCGLALLMTIPGFFVEGLVSERMQRANDVLRDISEHVGGSQTFLGPTLAIPYTVPPAKKDDAPMHGVYFVFPAKASALVNTATEERRKSLFKVPVFQADLKLDAAFDLAGVPSSAPPGAQLDWDNAEFVVGVSDARGALADAVLTVGGKNFTLVPAQNVQSLSIGGNHDQSLNLTLFGARVKGSARPDAQFDVSAALRFSGAQRIAVVAYGKTTHVLAHGDWASPGFDGGFLPVSRSVAKSGYTAEWSVPFIARGIRAEGEPGQFEGLDATAMGVSFIEVADPYQSVDRSLKYILLFLGLLFLSYFVFEGMTGKRLHAAQYVLVGMAQIIFYLLLLSLTERIGFDFGFLIAGVATVLLLSANAAWVFAARIQGVRALGVFSTLYLLIYVLLRLEDEALLVGAIASFAVIAAAMYFTRGIDWYSSLPAAEIVDHQPMAPRANDSQ